MWTFSRRAFQAKIRVCAKALLETCLAQFEAVVGSARSRMFGDEGGAEQEQKHVGSTHVVPRDL